MPVHGPTGLELSQRGNAGFNESDIVYTNNDMRFTVNGNSLYAIVLAWPDEDVMYLKSFY